MPQSDYRVLLVGSGAREHALAKTIVQSAHPHELFCFGSSTNPGIKQLSGEYRSGNINDAEAVVAFATAIRANLAVVGPEAPLEAGVADALWDAGIPVAGPKKALALIETSKHFTRELMAEYGIPGCPKFHYFDGLAGVREFLEILGEQYVVKADGLMGGKGVKVAGDHLHNHEEALVYCRELIDAGSSFVVEEKCVGEEFSLFSFSDGKTLKHMPPVQDHKRAYVGDKGPNTGGMGSYSDADHGLPFINQTDIDEAQAINQRVVDALREKTGEGYKGILYGGYMATADGIRVIEFNARFGDPEVMNLLSLLQTDFLSIMGAITGEHLAEVEVSFKKQASVCKYAVPEGYPDTPQKGFEVGIKEVAKPGQLYLGAVDMVDGKLVATGSRTAAVVGLAPTIPEAEAEAEALINQIKGRLFHRPDIGKAALIEKRKNHMRALRGK